jgi:hypothetical protein
MTALSELYKTDFHAWTLKAAELIRQHRFDIAVRETLLSPERFPQTCPYVIDEILDFDFYPNEP